MIVFLCEAARHALTSVPVADPFAGKTLAVGFAVGAMFGAWVGNRMAWVSTRWARVVWHEVQRHRRLRRLRSGRPPRYGSKASIDAAHERVLEAERRFSGEQASARTLRRRAGK